MTPGDASRSDPGDSPDPEIARRRLALTRVLIWAENEAQAMEMDALSERLREAIRQLHPEEDLP